MTTSASLTIFHRLQEQVDSIHAIARQADTSDPAVAQSLRRSAYVLAVAALDTFFHEVAADKLTVAAMRAHPEAVRVANYIQNVSVVELTGQSGPSYVRLRLSYKTLVAPRSVDAAIAAWGDNPEALWLHYSLAQNSRPDRERRQLELVYDRRNQIAHEADWDSIQFDFREMSESHLVDCLSTVRRVAEGFSVLL
ncbi:hypothetical protein AABM26_04260 [Curtobacterium aetherium]|uniref:hypothetical protein n=1 Tax=Curtobacterium aetherium TaxID=2841594 RepID=UPI003B515626